MKKAAAKRSSLLGRVLISAIVLGAILAAAGSPYPLIRLGAGLAALGLAVASLLVRMLPRRRLRILTSWWWLAIIALGITNFTVYFTIGGGAMNGKSEDGRYYVTDHGRYAEVSAAQYYSMAGLDLLMLLLLPAGFLLAAASERPGGVSASRGARQADGPGSAG